MMHWLSLAPLCKPNFCFSVLRVTSGPRLKLASCKSALKLPVVYSTFRSKAVVPVLVLLFIALWFTLRCDLFYALACALLLPYVQQSLGLHHIRTKLYQLPVTNLCSLQKEVVDTKTYVQNSPE